MSKPAVFILDPPARYPDGFASGCVNVSLTMFPDSKFPAYMWRTPRTCKAVNDVSKILLENPCELIILGNNLYGGVDLTSFIPEDKRPKVIVVSELELNKEDKAIYHERGVKRFALRSQVPEIISKLG